MNAALPTRTTMVRGFPTRRQFLKTAATATGAVVLTGNAGAAPPPVPTAGALVDVNVSLGPWPLRRLPHDTPERLAALLRARGVTQAWTGSLDGLLHKDLDAVNARLAEACRRVGRGLLLPFGSVNPAQPAWERDLERCAAVHGMRGLRLHPNYHGYRLDEPSFARLLQQAADRRLAVQLALVMEDERMMHPRLRVEPVDPAPLAAVVRQVPGLRLVLLNALRTLRGESLRQLLAAGQVGVELSMLEGVGGVGTLLSQVPEDRVLYGSHAPLFYWDAAALKLQESRLAQAQLDAIRHGNARRFLGTPAAAAEARRR